MASSAQDKKGLLAPPNPSEISRVKIFPPIGLARVGDSGFDNESGTPDPDTLEYFFPPEVPGIEEVQPENFKFREDPEKRAERVARKVKANLTDLAQKHNLDLHDAADRQVPILNGKSLNEIEAHLTKVFDDHHDRIKRQAVRFRVYAYDKDGKNLGEITAQDGYTLTWTVHLANHKSSWRIFRGIGEEQELGPAGPRNPEVQGDLKPEQRDRLIVDPGPRTISSPDVDTVVDISGTFYGSRPRAIDVHLGQLRTNEQGHLIFISGAGYSRSTSRKFPHADIVSGFDSADWIDDISDGWANVVVNHSNLKAPIEPSSKATVVSAPPKFAWGVRSPTTWFDTIENIYAKQSDRWVDDEGKGVNFDRHIWPVLQSAYAISWTNKDAFTGHGISGKGNFMDIKERLKSNGPENKVFRQAVFNRLRAPDNTVLTQATTQYMPRLSGNAGHAIEPGISIPFWWDEPPIEAFAALTALQYERFTLWKDGQFNATPVPWEGKKELKDIELKYQPLCLTLAALDHTIGDPLYPGIEVPWVTILPKTYVLQVDTDEHRIDPPFRIDHDRILPGYITRGLSIPWQSDFDNCHTHWWPSIRADDVINERFFEGSEISEKDFIDKVLPHRLPWTRGLRFSVEETRDYYPGSTDMVKYWPRLGFTVKHPNKKIKRQNREGSNPVWLETEREKIVRKDKTTQLPFQVQLEESDDRQGL